MEKYRWSLYYSYKSETNGNEKWRLTQWHIKCIDNILQKRLWQHFCTLQDVSKRYFLGFTTSVSSRLPTMSTKLSPPLIPSTRQSAWQATAASISSIALPMLSLPSHATKTKMGDNTEIKDQSYCWRFFANLQSSLICTSNWLSKRGCFLFFFFRTHLVNKRRGYKAITWWIYKFIQTYSWLNFKSD